ncbi:hypothetical protein NBB33_23750, partial [Salmonella sp. NW1189]|uniref:hypothetical protein n=1 Tax=Salmonella sp. NW1189 TaxID=2947625 RepID=UPI003F446F2D
MEIAASRWKSLSSANIFAVGATHAVPFELAAWGFAHSTLCHLNRHHPNGYDEQHKQKKRTEWSANSLARHYRSPFFSMVTLDHIWQGSNILAKFRQEHRTHYS